MITDDPGFTDRHPFPDDNAVARLVHTLDVYDEDDYPPGDEEWVLVATSGMYGKGVVTGLTWGDLRTIRDLLTKTKEK